MPNPNGIITRKDIISDDALDFGKDYAKNIQTAIDANKVLVESVKELNKQVQSFKTANSQKDYITAKQAEALATQKAIDALKLQEAAELSANKIKRDSIATIEAERKAKQSATDAEVKNQKAKNASVKLTIEERVQNEINNKVLKQEALERLGLVSAYTKLNKARTDAKNTLRDLIASETASTSEIKKAQKEYDVLDKKVRKADLAVNDFTKNVGNYPFANATSGIKNLIGAFGITGGIAAFAGIMKGAYETTKLFEQGIADLSAITGASGKDLDYLKSQAIELGKSTKGGAVQVVEAYKLIASAKPELLENVKDLNAVTESVLVLSKASGQELPEAATSLTDALNQFNAPASKAGEFVDALANGAKYGAAEIPQVTEALLKFGSVARSSNISIQESTALIELLAENGLKGADAGTALRNVLLKISAPDALPTKAQKALTDLGISFEFLKDKSVPIQEKLEALKPILKDNASLVKVFGLENIVAAQNIIGHTDRLKDLTSKMGEYGTAQEQADIRSNTLQGDTDRLGSTYDSLVLTISNGSGVVSGFFRFFTQGATNALEALIRLNKSTDELLKDAAQKGAANGKKLFDERFNSMIGDKISDQQREKIRGRIKEIDDEIAKGNFSTSLKTEKTDLQNKIGKSTDELSISLSIAKAAFNQAKVYEAQIKDINKKIKEDSAFGGIGSDGTTRLTTVGLKEEKERLIKSLAEQNAIVEENNKKVRASRIKITPDEIGSDTSVDETDAERKKREAAAKKAAKDKLDREKQLADSLFELQKQRLEQTISFNQEIVADDTQSDEIRVQALYNSQKKQEDLLLLTRNHLLDNDKLTANDRIRINEDYSNKLIELNTKTQKEVDRINLFDEGKYIKDLEDKISKSNEAMNAELEAENKKLIALGDLEKLSQKDREDAIETHEKAIFDIKKKYAIEALKLQIANLKTELDASDLLPEKEQLTAEKRQKIAETLSKAKLDLTEIELSDNDKKNKKTVDEELKKVEKILEISQQLTAALGDLANALFERKLQNIDEEISRNDEYYAKQIELAGNDQAQKDLLTEEAEKKRKDLEDKKRKEQRKQAVFNKALNATQVLSSTALAIIQSYAQLGPIAGSAGAIVAGVIGAIQLAAVLAAPIPKYKHGRKGGPEELAFVGDGGVREVIESKSGAIQITPASDTLVKLKEGDKVHSSIAQYNRLQRAAMMSSINMQGQKLNDFQVNNSFDNAYNREILEELKRNTVAIEKNKSKVIVQSQKIDINHHLWKMGNTNWK